MNDNYGLTLGMLTQLMSNMGDNDHINAVRFMKEKDDVDYAHHADEVEVSVHTESGNVRYFVLDFAHPEAGWVETV
jgi:hypothetical protein